MATREVYVEGDLGNPADLVIWDAVTDTKIDVVEFQYAALLGTFSRRAKIREAGLSGSETVDVIPCPRILKSGDRVYRFRLEQMEANPTEDFIVEAGCLEVMPYGGIRTVPQKSWHGRQVADKQALKGAQDPEGVLKAVLGNTVAHAAQKIAEQIAADFIASGGLLPALQRVGARPRPSPMAGAIPPGPTIIARTPQQALVDRFATPAPASKPAECPECWGTGHWKGSGKPCSKGCKKP